MDVRALADEEVFERARAGDEALLLHWYRVKGQDSPYFFSKAIAGYADLTEELHRPICEWLVDSERYLFRGLLIPRKYFKSSMTKAYVLRVLTGPEGPDERILFVGENEDVAAKNLTDIQWKFKSDKFFQKLYPHLIPADQGRDWPMDAMTLPRSRSYDEPTIRAVGIGTKHTGFHYTKIIYDDPIGWKAARSRPDMETAIEWFQAAPGLHDSTKTQELYIGTRWKHGKADLPGWIMAEMPYRVIDGEQEGYQWMIRSAIENGQSIFPPQRSSTGKRIGYSLRDLERMKKRMRTYLFNANMMNAPSVGDDRDFRPEWMGRYHIAQDRRGLVIEGTGERVELVDLLRTSFYDPSVGGIAAQAENAIVVIGVDWKGRIFVLDTWSKNCTLGQAVERWHVMNDKWHCAKNHYEAVGAHKEVGEKFRERPNPCRCGKIHRRIRPLPILPPPALKEDRIRDYAQVPFEEGRVWMGTWMTDLEKQLQEFPHGDMVDLVDALAYAIHLARKPAHHDPDQKLHPEDKLKGRRMEKRVNATIDYGGY